ncbi:MAG: helix-turn-helix domain-containing protein [bacterium]
MKGKIDNLDMEYQFTEFSTNAEFHIKDVNYLEQFNNSTSINSYSFIWTSDEALEVRIDQVPIILEPNSIMALTPIQHLAYISGGENAIVYQFNREFYCIKDHDQEVGCAGLLFFGNNYVPIITLDKEEQRKYKLLHEIFLDELATKDNIQAEMLRMLMSRFIIKTTRILKNTEGHIKKDNAQLDLLRKYNVLVETHYKSEHGVAFYADKLFKSPKTLSNAFSKFNKSPLKIIHNRIVLEAKRQLMYSAKTAKEIAYDLGFDDASHLSRLFKKHTQLSPSEFKNQLQKTA